MDQNSYRDLKESGGLVTDAALQEEEHTEPVIIEEEEPDQPDAPIDDELEDADEPLDEVEDDDLPPLNEKEKTAFDKRLERERTKLQEKLEADLKQQYEQQYGKHKEVLESLGGDADAILLRIQENKMIAEANRVAEANGWDDEQTQWYYNQQKEKVEQQRRDKELQELRVQMQINKLRDNPDYAGIQAMEKDIVAKIGQTNGGLNVEEAFWALGGPKRAEQIRLEATVRAQVKSQKQPRTVLTDAPTTTTGEKPLPADVLRDAERMGISPADARRLMSKEPAKNIDEWRKSKQAK